MTKKILIDEAVVKQALEWIEDAAVVLSHTSTAIQGGLGAEAEGVGGCSVKVLKDLREALEVNNKGVNALAQQSAQQEPVAWGLGNTAITGSNRWMMLREQVPADDQYGGAMWTPLYTHPASTQQDGTNGVVALQPLTDERLSEIESRILQEGGSYAEVLRAVADEAVHTGSKT